MEYNRYDKHGNEPVDGFIMQGSISDREGYVDALTQTTVDDILSLAKEMIDAGRGDDVVSKSKLPPGCCWVRVGSSLSHGPCLADICFTSGDDDYFSSDLPDEKAKEIWATVKKPILIVPSAEDEYVPPSVDFEKLLAKWKSHCPEASDLSALIPGAGHTVQPASSQEWLAQRVVSFLERI